MFYDRYSSSMDHSNRMTGLHGICASRTKHRHNPLLEHGFLAVASVPEEANAAVRLRGRNGIRAKPAKLILKRYKSATFEQTIE